MAQRDLLELAALQAIESFYKITLAEWMDLPPTERAFIAGCILGNYSAHHPGEAFALLHQIKKRT